MYDELIKALRNCTNPDKCCEDCGFFDKCYKNKEHFSIEEQAADAIEELQKDLERSKDFEAFWQHEAEEALKKFQVAISNKPRWIPVAERLPERDIDVLVFAIGKIDGFLDDHVIAIARRCIFRLVSWVDGEETWSDPWQFFHTDYEITHWMPLPEPPKDGEP